MVATTAFRVTEDETSASFATCPGLTSGGGPIGSLVPTTPTAHQGQRSSGVPHVGRSWRVTCACVCAYDGAVPGRPLAQMGSTRSRPQDRRVCAPAPRSAPGSPPIALRRWASAPSRGFSGQLLPHPTREHQRCPACHGPQSPQYPQVEAGWLRCFPSNAAVSAVLWQCEARCWLPAGFAPAGQSSPRTSRHLYSASLSPREVSP